MSKCEDVQMKKINKYILAFISISANQHIRTSAFIRTFVFISISAHLLIYTFAFAQQNKIDSLLTLLKKDKEDTNKVNHLNNLSREYRYINAFDSSLALANSALKLANVILTLNDKNGMNQTVKQTAQKGIAIAYNNIGLVYDYHGDYPNALDYYIKGLKVAEVLENKNIMAAILGNIGNVYDAQDDYTKALDYYLKALKIAEELGDKKRIAIQLGNIGNAYKEPAKAASGIKGASDSLYKKSLDYYFRALKIDEELGNKNGIARHLGNIGLTYDYQGNYPKALDYCFKALKITEELGNKNDIAAWLGNIGAIYTRTGNYKEAEFYLKRAISLDDSIGSMNESRQFEEYLSQLYDTTGRYQLALEHYKKAMALKDTLFSEEKNKEITRKEMTYEFEKKAAAAKAEADKQAAVAEAESKKQKIVIWSVIAVLLLVIVFAGFIFRALRITQKQKRIIEQQKKIVEEKQSEILASIRYAKRIQDTILPTEKYIDKTLKRLMKNN
ncbi:MAG: tetratricopeptide repeat protein [Bacteroidetes bacterium]|nr:tetratricopeptide repeat protein [Bacteroidota bacterium]